MKNFIFNIGWFLFLVIGVVACVSQYKNLKKTNFAHLYTKSNLNQKIKLKAYHLNDSTTRIYTKFPKSFFEKPIEPLICNFYLWKDNQFVDSLTTQFKYKNPVSFKDLNVQQGNDYQIILQIRTIDSTLLQNTFLINKTDRQHPQNFLVKNAQSDVVFDNLVFKNQAYELFYRDSLNVEDVEIEYFQPKYRLPLPPFSETTTQKPSYTTSKKIDSSQLFFDNTGKYVVRDKQTPEIKYTFLVMEDKFPRLSSAADLVLALRYITKNEEYEKMIRSENQKKAVDNFWLEKAGSEERGKILIKEFYGRVQRANELFTNDIPGWITDRGIIYIIYGQPDVVLRGENLERWEYNNSKRDFLNFTFDIVGYTYQVRKSINYKESWDKQVSQWRNGIINKVSF